MDSAEAITLSFYRYHKVKSPEALRDQLREAWAPMGILGRIYVAHEGINAQLSVPTQNWASFERYVRSINWLREVRFNFALEGKGLAFRKLKIKVRPRIVADGLDEPGFDPSQSGRHLDAEHFNALTEHPETVVVDMRNHYESEIGHFEGAICPEATTFREALQKMTDELGEEVRERPVVMYCTGGIRCEKASAWLRHRGFREVYQLEGGIIQYKQQVEEKGLTNKFRGKNFVFDDRRGERVGEEVISRCHQCGAPCDHHVNCRNAACHLLFIQCDECAAHFDGCCSELCQEDVAVYGEESGGRAPIITAENHYYCPGQPGVRLQKRNQ